MQLELKNYLHDHGWKGHLLEEFNKEYMVNLQTFLKTEYDAGKTIYPAKEEIFSALNATTLHNVKAVILGQDPYHGEGQAHGMAFSVKPEVKIPPSLVNIFKEIESDLGIPPHENGYLMHWAQEGVLLLNTVLTVEKAKAHAHKKKGWEQFTDKIIQTVNRECENVVFFLWGAPAQKKESMIDQDKHLILKAPHPSPLSSYRGFFGCRHFSKCNNYLLENGDQTIDWKL